jgi:hypothetical protein
MTTPFDLESPLRLWTDPLPEDDSAEDASKGSTRTRSRSTARR